MDNAISRGRRGSDIEGYIYIYMYINGQAISRGRRGSDCMVFVCTSTYATGAYSMYLSY